jgi:3-phosphoshikimate 1-carboxyvinyltransferase
MVYKITPKVLSGEVNIIKSKSFAHRALIAASLSNGNSMLHDLPRSDDVLATLNALKHMGIQFKDNQVVGGAWHYDGTTIDCLASGSTLRFLIPLCLRLKEEVILTGTKKLLSRPLQAYQQLFSNELEVTPDYVKTKGPIKASYFKLNGDVSSQYVTGLLMTLPLLKRDSVIELTSPLQSKSYVNMTVDVMKQFGLHVVEFEQKYLIQGKQHYVPTEMTIEGDYSQAAFFMVAALIGKKITIKGLQPHSLQGDRAMVDIIQKMKGRIEYDETIQGYHVFPSETVGTELDLEDIPDLGPILMILAALSKGTTHLINTQRLKYKESDRLKVMCDILTSFGVTVEQSHNELWINGQRELLGHQRFQTFEDHRIAMTLAIASIRANGPIEIEHPEVVSKSYPEFFKVFQLLGGNLYET